MPDTHGGREVDADVVVPVVVLNEPNDWLVNAVHAALDRAVCCEHIGPGVPAALVLRSGWLNCKSPECSANCPSDMRVQPPSGAIACERCGSEADVMVAYLLSDALDVVFLTCPQCQPTERSER